MKKLGGSVPSSSRGEATENEAKLTTLEEEGSDALEVAAQAHEEGEAQACPEGVRSEHFSHLFSLINSWHSALRLLTMYGFLGFSKERRIWMESSSENGQKTEGKRADTIRKATIGGASLATLLLTSQLIRPAGIPSMRSDAAPEPTYDFLDGLVDGVLAPMNIVLTGMTGGKSFSTSGIGVVSEPAGPSYNLGFYLIILGIGAASHKYGQNRGR